MRWLELHPFCKACRACCSFRPLFERVDNSVVRDHGGHNVLLLHRCQKLQGLVWNPALLALAEGSVVGN